MNEKDPESGSKFVAVRPVRHSIEEILKHVDPGPDDETERFVAVIYEDRRKYASIPLPE